MGSLMPVTYLPLHAAVDRHRKSATRHQNQESPVLHELPGFLPSGEMRYASPVDPEEGAPAAAPFAFAEAATCSA